MEYVIGVMIIIVVIIIIGLILRKRLYDSVDYYENWKLDIMGRNVATELSKIKVLNLEGNTKKKFEKWKGEWETILAEDLADVEELLYDTEIAADRYRFSSAKAYMKKMEAVLVDVEKRIENILTELNKLLDTEESNRKEIEQLGPLLKELQKQLSQNRYQYSKAEVRFEVELENIQQQLSQYDSLKSQGEYMEAAKIVEETKKQLAELEAELNDFPEFYKLCKDELPTQLDELYKGITEMKAEGYRVEHLKLEKEIKEYQTRLLDIVSTLEKEGIDKVKRSVQEMEERVQEMFQLLENEALAKNFIQAKMPSYEKALENFETQFIHTKSEVGQLKEAYYFEDADLEKYMTLEKNLTQLKEQVAKITKEITENSAAHSKMREELEVGFEQLDKIIEEHEQFKKQIQNLRKDELEARNQLQEMNENINKMNRKLRHSNLPGVPNFIWTMIEEARERNDRVIQALESQPLDMVEVQKSLSEAKSAIENAMDQSDMMLEQAYLTERVIQYANRYRSSNPSLAAKLVESESLFRKGEYELALEEAAKAVEEVEPGALKKIEQMN